MSGDVVAVVLAGGSGTRFGAPVSKVYVDLGGRPVIAHSLAAFESHPDVDHVVLVVRAEDRGACAAVLADAASTKVRAVVDGGATRQASEWAGIEAVTALDLDDPLVLLHDAARPLTTPDLVSGLIAAARDGAGAIPAVGVTDDLVDPVGRRVTTDDLVAVQTPQAFPLHVLRRTYPAAIAGGFDGVDTAQTVDAFADVEIRWVASSAENLKITHPADLDRAEAILSARR